MGRRFRVFPAVPRLSSAVRWFRFAGIVRESCAAVARGAVYASTVAMKCSACMVGSSGGRTERESRQFCWRKTRSVHAGAFGRTHAAQFMPPAVARNALRACNHRSCGAWNAICAKWNQLHPFAPQKLGVNRGITLDCLQPALQLAPAFRPCLRVTRKTRRAIPRPLKPTSVNTAMKRGFAVQYKATQARGTPWCSLRVSYRGNGMFPLPHECL